eukprot:TRINITY_DN25813_c0_g1_i1.p1 TRINITY_DN25813_c0_g1~~TRINITY_DN25813_c0_g1_i1.p1  ORF type:complete len:103 (+),score=0.01 TRINITY_DN25813_c0_g1_i1:174-482(+)
MNSHREMILLIGDCRSASGRSFAEGRDNTAHLHLLQNVLAYTADFCSDGKEFHVSVSENKLSASTRSASRMIEAQSAELCNICKSWNTREQHPCVALSNLAP